MNGLLLSTLLAHQGGWDEFMLIAIPVVFIGGLLLLANRRVNERLRDTEAVNAEAANAADSTTSEP